MEKSKYVHLLGEGSFGVAVKIVRENHVLKITSDAKEYEIAQQLKGRKNKNLVDIYDCYKVGQTFYIWQEYLEKGPARLDLVLFANTFKKILADCINMEFPSRGLAPFWAGLEYIKEHNENFIRCALNKYRNSLQAPVYVDMFLDTCQAIQELNTIDKKAYIDVHGCNIGFTNCGKMKYFDLSKD